MPCDTITTVNLELKNANLDLLKKAIKSVTGEEAEIYNLGLVWRGGRTYNKLSGILTARTDEEAKLIKQSYSAEIVKMQAQRFGWQVKQTANFKYQIMKR
jgi:hypothetical protein